MKYFLDTEFIEKPNTIDLISIGIIDEDNNTYYAISKDFNLKEAWDNEWIRDNVLLSIYTEKLSGDIRNQMPFNKSTLKWILKDSGKTNKQISKEILEFVKDKPEFYAYYADYDWVVFCWLFGKMNDLPNRFPMYCRDLKQTMDEKDLDEEWLKKECPPPDGEHNALIDAEWNMKLYNKIKELK